MRGNTYNNVNRTNDINDSKSEKVIIVLLQISAVHYDCHIANLPRFGVAQILDVLKWLASDKRSSRLNGELVDVIRKMAELLGEGLKKEGRDCLGEEEVKDVYLPDRDRSLYPVTELCLNDCDWLEESDTMHFLHPEFSEHLAKVFWAVSYTHLTLPTSSTV